MTFFGLLEHTSLSRDICVLYIIVVIGLEENLLLMIGHNHFTMSTTNVTKTYLSLTTTETLGKGKEASKKERRGSEGGTTLT